MAPYIIAEIKTKSPFGFESKYDSDTLLNIALKVGDMVAAHTDPKWGGSFEHLNKVCDRAHKIGKKVLAKGIHDNDFDIFKAIEYGADYVLVVGRFPHFINEHYYSRLIIEPLTLNEINYIPPGIFGILWNARDLQTGQRKTNTVAEARKIAGSRILIQGSFVTNQSDFSSDANYVLIGEHLPEYARYIINE